MNNRNLKITITGLGLLSLLVLTQNFTRLEFDGDILNSNETLLKCPRVKPLVAGTFTITKDIVYTKSISKVPNEVQAFDFSRPKDGLLRPLAIVVHGGGWQNGSKDDGGVKNVTRNLVSKGFAVANFNYPLVQVVNGVRVNQFPIPVQALRCGMRYLSKNAAALGIDKTRVVTYGASAGGNLSSMLAYAGDDTSGVLDSTDCEHKLEPLLPVHASITNSGVYAFRVATAFSRPGARAFLGNANCDPLLDQEVLLEPEPKQCRDYRWAQAAKASPRQYINANTPPTFAIHSLDDQTVNYDQYEWLTKTLKEFQVPFSAVTIDGKDHVPNIFDEEGLQRRSAMCQMFDFLESVIGTLPSL